MIGRPVRACCCKAGGMCPTLACSIRWQPCRRTPSLARADGPHPGLTMPENTDFNALSDLLTGGIRRDFTFLHPEIMDEKCRVDGAKLRLENKVNFEDYSVIIIPSVSAIHWSNLRKIKAFYDAGGKVIATTQLPTLSAEFGHDHDVRKAVEAMFSSASVNDQGYARKTNKAGGASYFVPSLQRQWIGSGRRPERCHAGSRRPVWPRGSALRTPPSKWKQSSQRGKTLWDALLYSQDQGRPQYLLLRELDGRTCGARISFSEGS